MIRQPRPGALVLVACAALVLAAATRPAQPSVFGKLVDEYLDAFASRHPSIAAGNGLHLYDGRLDDFSAAAVADEVVELGHWRQRLRRLDPARLSPQERIDHRILAGIVDGWLLDLGDVQTWRTNPMIYAVALSDGVRALMTVDSALPEVRARQVISKLGGVTFLLASARANVTNPPAVFVVRGGAMFRAVADVLRRDLPQAFRGLRDTRLQTGLREAGASAADAIDEYAAFLQADILPRAIGSYAVGAARLEARYRAEEMIDLSVEQLLAIGERELRERQEEFRAVAERIAPGRNPREVWGDIQRDHPPRGQLVEAAQRTVGDLLSFVTSKRILALPPHAAVVVAPAPAFDLGLASMRSSPPLAPRPVKSYYYLSDADVSWPIERQEAWLQAFNYETLADISAREVYPGRYAQSLLMQRTNGKLRRIWAGLNPFPQPSSGLGGWAHYAEQLVQDEGFHAADPRYRLAQVNEALTQICRLIAGIRLHAGSWTVEQAATFFEEQAHLPVPAARQEAERGTYDPTGGGPFLGKLAALKLRGDVAARDGTRFDLRAFHTRLLVNGIAPWWAQRQMFLPGDTRPVID